MGCAGAHLLRLTAWELHAGSSRACRRVAARRGRARTTAHAACSSWPTPEPWRRGREASRRPTISSTCTPRSPRSLLACAGDAPRGRTVLLLSCERPAALHRLLHARSDLCAGRHQLAAPFRAAPPPPCARLPRARRDPRARAHALRRRSMCLAGAPPRGDGAAPEAAPHAGRRRRRAPWREPAGGGHGQRRPRGDGSRGAPGGRCAHAAAGAVAGAVPTPAGWATRARRASSSTALPARARAAGAYARGGGRAAAGGRGPPAARRRGPRPVGPGSRGRSRSRDSRSVPAAQRAAIAQPEGGGGGRMRAARWRSSSPSSTATAAGERRAAQADRRRLDDLARRARRGPAAGRPPRCALRVSAPATAARRRLLARQLLALGASRVGAAELAAHTAGFTRSAVASCGGAALAAPAARSRGHNFLRMRCPTCRSS